jgi:AhpD family alkylhydroperoxidase
MARIRMLSPEQLDPELRAVAGADKISTRQLAPVRAMGHDTELTKAYVQFGGAVRACATLSARFRELIRLRIAFHNQCRSCMAIRYSDALEDGLTEDMVCSLEKPYEAPGLTEAERVGLRYADLMATNHLAIDDALYAELHRHYTEQQVVELGVWCAITVGFGRLQASWQMIEELPGQFSDPNSGKLAPWGSESWVAQRPSIARDNGDNKKPAASKSRKAA